VRVSCLRWATLPWRSGYRKSFSPGLAPRAFYIHLYSLLWKETADKDAYIYIYMYILYMYIFNIHVDNNTMAAS